MNKKLKILSLTLFLLLLSFTLQSQTKDTNFIHKLTEPLNFCRDCSIDDYYLPIVLKLEDSTYKTVVLNNELKRFLVGRIKGVTYCNVTDYVRNILINEDTIILSREILKKSGQSQLFAFLDIWKGDTIFNKLKYNKKEFINYYFDTNGVYKFSNEFILKDKNDMYLHDKVYKFTAVISQLYEWEIPVHFGENSMELGYYKKDS